jgi:hypothetical protein
MNTLESSSFMYSLMSLEYLVFGYLMKLLHGCCSNVGYFAQRKVSNLLWASKEAWTIVSIIGTLFVPFHFSF